MRFNSEELQKYFAENGRTLLSLKSIIVDAKTDIQTLVKYLEENIGDFTFTLKTEKFELTFNRNDFFYKSDTTYAAGNRPVPLFAAGQSAIIEAHRALPQFLKEMTAWLQSKDIV